jgi:ferredoxin
MGVDYACCRGISSHCWYLGACEGSLACSTCHVIIQDQQYYNKLDEPSDEENDMLDLAFGLTEKYVLTFID